MRRLSPVGRWHQKSKIAYLRLDELSRTTTSLTKYDVVNAKWLICVKLKKYERDAILDDRGTKVRGNDIPDRGKY
jgi:hypothetical protein